MNKHATVRVHGNAGVGVAENIMSGTVVVDGNASQSAGATGRGGLLVVRGDASSRCGISMKGVDDRRARLGRPHGRVHGPDGRARRLRRRRRRARRLDLRGAHLRARHGRAASAPTASRRSCATSTATSCATCSRAPASTTPTRPSSAATARRGGSTTSTSTTPGSTRWPALATAPRPARVARSFDRNAIHEIQRAAREGIYDIRGWGAKRHVPHFDDLLFLGASVSRYPLEGYRERCDTDVVLGDALRDEAARAEDPDHDRGHELRRALGAGQGGARPRRERGRHVHDDRRRRHDARGARALRDARLPAAAVALRHEPRRPAARRRDRGRRRPGRQAGRRRHAARPEDLRPRGRDARPAEGDRPAQRLPAPGLDRARRPRDQDRRAARDHRLGEADLRQDRRVAHVLRRRAGGEGGRRRDRARRHAGRHGRHPGGVHRARRHPDPAPRSRRRSSRCRSSACTARCSSSSRAASAPAPTSPRRWRSAPTPCRSASPR